MHPKKNELYQILAIRTWHLMKISKANHRSRMLKKESKNTENREMLLRNWLFSRTAQPAA